MFDNLFSVLWSKILAPILSLVGNLLGIAFIIISALVTYCFMKYRMNPLKVTRQQLLDMRIRLKPANFIRWFILDRMDAPKNRSRFREFGVTLYCGRQGAGKTISMVEYLARMRHRYPECIIVTNFECAFADQVMESWRDFMEIRNGEKGVIFGIDEIHSEYSAASWKDFPETLLSQISQQRKQCVKIVATAQVFSRVVKQIREQTFSVVVCRTFAQRWTFCREYDAKDFEAYCDSPVMNKKIRSLWKYSFVQSNRLRSCYDTYAIIERMKSLDFIARGERGA